MKKYSGAVFFDIDGTLIETKRGIDTISENTRRAIASLNKKGYLTCIASGRTRNYLPVLGDVFEGYITCNGAVAEVDGKILFEKFVEPEVLKHFMKYMDTHGFGYILENSEQCFTTLAGNRTFQGLTGRLSKNYDCFYPITDLTEPESFRVCKLQIACDDEIEFKRIQTLFAKDFEITPHRYEIAADVAPRGTSKASGIQELIQYLEIPKENTYAFGDDYNDLQMLQTVAHGIAMTPHVPPLDDIAEYVTGTVEEEGVFHGLLHYGLISQKEM